jgi:hypothetical protein
LVFEGPPELEPPLAQDPDCRRPEVRDGGVLDTRAACPPLTIVELNRFHELWAKEALRLKPEAQKARRAFIAEQTKRLTERTNLTPEAAQQVIIRKCSMLLPEVELPFDDDDLTGCTVADVLGDPDRFEEATLADPLEGVDYGRGKAKIMLGADGTPWIHSFAHGRTIYELRYGADVVHKEIKNATKEKVVQVFVRHMLNAELDATETAELLELVAKQAECGKKRAIQQSLTTAREQHQRHLKREEDERKRAERRDPRPQLLVPNVDEPFIPQMQVLNEVLGALRAAEPPMRDPDGFIVQVRVRRMPGMHELTSAWGEPGQYARHQLAAAGTAAVDTAQRGTSR